MFDKASGYLEVCRDDKEVIVNHPDLKPDAQGVGHITFSPEQARSFAKSLNKFAKELEDLRAENHFRNAAEGILKHGE